MQHILSDRQGAGSLRIKTTICCDKKIKNNIWYVIFLAQQLLFK